MLTKYKIGDLVFAKLGTLPLVGTVVYLDKKGAQYLVRFSATQQLYYAETDLTPYHN
ncbi:hypothetical protein [Lactiplantibacillus mudanjiangensis]|uniref:DUF2187 domain-containing protein n=1 Tax=Lactiplantibacillus mudanjiangensis TaxID=1296538 RepID=A0A660DYF2_9LACO|nr:hypothetical protein [Lactiplantibacillus mudanjiangensis]VDG19492.1 putative protein [Lactobacillus brevis] [Lactiplantibacillus mudanjiangensis]VDG25168.1 putative protein [Lactobacillus brevis] [Lactiplantibacillus mudanjiangensis]VDG28121.1 putative protein [Lactobacillus brevis] [Lactiplantibacillus mudanjiangensis]VDG30943.1 putative protein [Lactobacillus brevis] [Lactiplantibacillus mudanjiangensis]